MKYLQQVIIGSCYGADAYSKVSFLEASDFQNYAGAPYRKLWESIIENKAYDMTLVNVLSKSADSRLNTAIMTNCDVLGHNNLQRFAIKLVEMRFQTLLSTLLGDIASKANNALESTILNECQMHILKADIFTLSDNILDYLGAQASATTSNRINKFLEYRDKRASTIKKVTDGIR